MYHYLVYSVLRLKTNSILRKSNFFKKNFLLLHRKFPNYNNYSNTNYFYLCGLKIRKNSLLLNTKSLSWKFFYSNKNHIFISTNNLFIF